MALLSVIWVASQNTPWIEILYFIGLAALAIPIGTWLEQWELDLKTRNPRRYRPDLGEKPPAQIPIPSDEPAVWAHSSWVTVIWTTSVMFSVNFSIQMFVAAIAPELTVSK